MTYAKLKATCICVLLALIAGVSRSQEPAPGSPVELLDKLAGQWVLHGTIAGRQTTHDVTARWVLKGEYLRLHEVSREKETKGDPAYEAIVFVSWDAKKQQYSCLWLDSTAGGGLSAQGIAHARESGDSIPLLFVLSPSDSIHTTFSYDRKTDVWKWLIDDDSNGKTERFADVRLARSR